MTRSDREQTIEAMQHKVKSLQDVLLLAKSFNGRETTYINNLIHAHMIFLKSCAGDLAK